MSLIDPTQLRTRGQRTSLGDADTVVGRILFLAGFRAESLSFLLGFDQRLPLVAHGRGLSVEQLTSSKPG